MNKKSAELKSWVETARADVEKQSTDAQKESLTQKYNKELQTKKEKIDQETIKNLMNKLENSQPQTNNKSKIDELNSQIDILKKEIMNSDILKNELKMKLTETENNDKKTIEYLGSFNNWRNFSMNSSWSDLIKTSINFNFLKVIIYMLIHIKFKIIMQIMME